MIGIDSNVLIRLFTTDSPAQTAAALRLLEVSAPASVRVEAIVLVEIVWVMKRQFRSSKAAQIDLIERLLERQELVFSRRNAIMTALRWFEHGRADFADYLIAALNAEAGARPTLTFDVDAAAHPVFQVVPG
jgi:predicted nucleic-acid-binding protein